MSDTTVQVADAPAVLPGPTAGGARVKPSKLIVTLGLAGGVAGFLLVFVFGWTLPTIEANKAKRLEAAVREVLKAPDRYETLWVVNGVLASTLPDGADPRKVERVFLGYRGDQRVGFAIMASEPGFQDNIVLIFGYEPKSKQILGMKVLETKETPGLGDKIERDSFTGQFAGAETPIVGVKSKDPAGKDTHQIQMITGATISSRTVIRGINKALGRVGPLLDGARADGAAVPHATGAAIGDGSRPRP
jgi:electron transport complex protein RnfG